MSLTLAIVCFAVGTYVLRAGGLLLPDSELLDRLAGPVTAAILASLLVANTATTGTALTLDSRLVGLAAAFLAIAAKRSLITVLIVSVTVTAVTRLVF